MLAFLLTLPHAGLSIPEELIENNLLTIEEIIADGDEGAKEIYTPLQAHVKGFITSPIARAFIDLNRIDNDFTQDGVIKTHTCWNEVIYKDQPNETLKKILLEKYYYPYHQQIEKEISSGQYKLAIDCHTMAEKAPPVAPDAGKIRPMVCLSDGNGKSFPRPWLEKIQAVLQQELQQQVTINQPFSGGYTLRKYMAEIPYLQVEFSRTKVCSYEEKRLALLKALENMC